MEMNKIVEELQSRGINAECVLVNKNNEEKQGIIIRDLNTTICPVIYEDMIEENSIGEMANNVIAIHDKYKDNCGIDYNDMITKEFALANARLAICKKDWNLDRLENAIHERVGETDLELYVKCECSPNSAFTITREYIGEIGLTDEEVITAAKNNSCYSIRNMAEILAESMGIPVEDIPPAPMNVLTNESGYDGAAGIYDVEMLKGAMEKLNCSKIYIIPSSRHEVICVPNNDIDAETLEQMIGEVNETCVQMEDRLSDHAYIFDGETLKNATDKFEFHVEEIL